ncbi:hypothetical protein RRG08_002441 [Elysia crispata]|uniref:Secreted protein n=1 Tax=Elysia crispata TaxID=231223 RepID=A0AAE1DUH1_9GAST|nr:hypothetical protein RRG08_002441 [Elysia crispata]
MQVQLQLLLHLVNFTSTSPLSKALCVRNYGGAPVWATYNLPVCFERQLGAKTRRFDLELQHLKLRMQHWFVLLPRWWVQGVDVHKHSPLPGQPKAMTFLQASFVYTIMMGAQRRQVRRIRRVYLGASDEWDNVMQIWEQAMTGTMSCRSGSGRRLGQCHADLGEGDDWDNVMQI